MDFLIIAKSRGGWGVGLGSDVVAEFADPALARAHADGLREAMRAAGRAAEILDLSEATTGASLMPRDD